MKEKVSVIIPVYNAENFIRKCVESLADGTYKNIELILINDASRDNSFYICMELEKRYSCVILLNNEENHGVSYTRNRGLQVATGDLIMFADSDDWVEPDFIERMIEQHHIDENALVICGYINHDEVKNGRTDIFAWDNFEGVQIVNREVSLYQLYEQRLLQQLWNKIFQREIIVNYNIHFDETISIGEDFRFLLQYIKVGNIKKIIKYNYPLYHYSRDNQNSLMTKYGQEKIEEPLYNFQLLYELMNYSKEEIEKLIQKQRDEIIFQYGYAIIHNDKLSEKEKVRLMKENIGEGWKDSYKKNKKLLIKEKLSYLLRRSKN